MKKKNGVFHAAFSSGVEIQERTCSIQVCPSETTWSLGNILEKIITLTIFMYRDKFDLAPEEADHELTASDN